MLKQFRIKTDGYAYDKNREGIYTDGFILTYEMEVEVREYGIKSISFSPINISGLLSWLEIHPDESETDHDEMFDWHYTDKDADTWKIIDTVEFSSDGGFAPTDITVDFDRKEIEIS